MNNRVCIRNFNKYITTYLNNKANVMYMIEDKNLFEEVLYTQVRVKVANTGGSGTVIYSEKNNKGVYSTYILSCFHVINDALQVKEDYDPRYGIDRKKEMRQLVTVEFFDYLNVPHGHRPVSSSVDADIECYDKDHDMALLKLRTKSKVTNVAKLYPRDKISNIQLMDRVIAVGAALLHDPIITSGRITHMGDQIDYKDYWLSNSAIIYGNSGGAIFTEIEGNYYFIGIPSRIDVAGWGVPICYDKDTEVLTEDGWKYFKDLNNEKLITLNKDGKIEYHYPSKKVIVPYKGEMYHFKGRKIDLNVTPNHYLYVSKSNKKGIIQEPKFIKAMDLTPSNNIYMYSSGEWNCDNPKEIIIPMHKSSIGQINPEKKINVKEWLKFLGYYIAEGNLERWAVNITQATDSVYYNDIVNIIQKIGYTPHCYGNHIKIFNTGLVRYLEQYGNSASTKHLTSKELNLHPDSIGILLENMINGDGNWRNNYVTYFTSSKLLADDVQELCLKMGIVGRIYKEKGRPFIIRDKHYISRDGYRIVIGKQTRYVINPKRNLIKENYKGNVFCAIVPNHTLYVRRNGKPIWCGNTHMGYFSPINRVYEFLDEQKFAFVYDNSLTEEQCEEERKKLKEEMERYFRFAPSTSKKEKKK